MPDACLALEMLVHDVKIADEEGHSVAEVQGLALLVPLKLVVLELWGRCFDGLVRVYVKVW